MFKSPLFSGPHICIQYIQTQVQMQIYVYIYTYTQKSSFPGLPCVYIHIYKERTYVHCRTALLYIYTCIYKALTTAKVFFFVGFHIYIYIHVYSTYLHMHTAEVLFFLGALFYLHHTLPAVLWHPSSISLPCTWASSSRTYSTHTGRSS
jgi:hypothetical protein